MLVTHTYYYYIEDECSQAVTGARRGLTREGHTFLSLPFPGKIVCDTNIKRLYGKRFR